MATGTCCRHSDLNSTYLQQFRLFSSSYKHKSIILAPLTTNSISYVFIFCEILTICCQNDIIISRFNDIILEVLLLLKENKATRTRQVQFRMEPDKVKRLIAAIAYDDDMHSMADLFNKAADEYLKKQEKNGGNGNGK